MKTELERKKRPSKMGIRGETGRETLSFPPEHRKSAHGNRGGSHSDLQFLVSDLTDDHSVPVVPEASGSFPTVPDLFLANLQMLSGTLSPSQQPPSAGILSHPPFLVSFLCGDRKSHSCPDYPQCRMFFFLISIHSIKKKKVRILNV